LTTALIPAAGRGSRLGADTPKPLVRLGERTMLSYVLAAVSEIADQIVLVVSPGTERLFEDELARVSWNGAWSMVVQEQPAGSADAVRVGLGGVASDEPCLVIWGDQVGASANTSRRVADLLIGGFDGLVLPLIEVTHPYVWYSVDGDRVEVGRSRDGDATPDSGLSDVGMFGFKAGPMSELLAGQSVVASAREPDFVYVAARAASAHGLRVIEVADETETLAVNDLADLNIASSRLMEAHK
jgi:bifunctional UDP-N-acetylglucosamine pyrophosphorylase/glucosamine-1-phosphate N-acetyltransferase